MGIDKRWMYSFGGIIAGEICEEIEKSRFKVWSRRMLDDILYD
jgi:hypothetical protein